MYRRRIGWQTASQRALPRARAALLPSDLPRSDGVAPAAGAALLRPCAAPSSAAPFWCLPSWRLWRPRGGQRPRAGGGPWHCRCLPPLQRSSVALRVHRHLAPLRPRDRISLRRVRRARLVTLQPPSPPPPPPLPPPPPPPSPPPPPPPPSPPPPRHRRHHRPRLRPLRLASAPSALAAPPQALRPRRRPRRRRRRGRRRGRRPSLRPSLRRRCRPRGRSFTRGLAGRATTL